MEQIFISHSKDDPNVSFFHKVFSGTHLRSVFMELEDLEPPPWSHIKHNVEQSACVVVALSRPLEDYRHTRNWIDFEVGLACATGKAVWVLEPVSEEIEFPVPYCTHYAVFEPENDEHVKYFKRVFEEYAKPQPIIGMGMGLHKCTEDICKLSFFLMSDVQELRCPSCRTRQEKNVDQWKTFGVLLLDAISQIRKTD